jgi:nicotinamidase-related amidase
MKALLVIDMQKEGVRGLYKQKEVISNISKLIEVFQSRKCKIIQTKVWITNPKKTSMTKLWPNEGIANTKGAEIIPELHNKKYDKIIEKTNYSAFYNTKLDAYLKKNKIQELYLAGINAGCCVLFTAVDAFYLGYDVFLVKDAVSSSAGKEATENGIRNIETFCGKTINTSELLK